MKNPSLNPPLSFVTHLRRVDTLIPKNDFHIFSFVICHDVAPQPVHST
jgi:hypothetical protein